MGSGSSRCKGRLIKVRPGQPVKPQKLPAGENANDGNIATVLRTESEVAPVKDNLTEFRRVNLKARDPDLQLLDEVLAESEDCLSWQDPTGEGKVRESWSHGANSGFYSWLQPQGDVKNNIETLKEAHKQSQIQPPSSESERSRGQGHENNGRIGQLPINTVYTENNNLPKEFHGPGFNITEESAIVMYDDTEEALMDSIEEQYSQQEA